MIEKFIFLKKSLGLKFSKKNVVQQQFSYIFKTSILYKFKYFQFFNFLLFSKLQKSSIFIFHFLFNKFFLFKYFLNNQAAFFLKFAFAKKKSNIYKFVYFDFKKSQISISKLFNYQIFFFLKKLKYYEFFFLSKYF
jgi:hypothetical protein